MCQKLTNRVIRLRNSQATMLTLTTLLLSPKCPALPPPTEIFISHLRIRLGLSSFLPFCSLPWRHECCGQLNQRNVSGRSEVFRLYLPAPSKISVSLRLKSSTRCVLPFILGNGLPYRDIDKTEWVDCFSARLQHHHHRTYIVLKFSWSYNTNFQFTIGGCSSLLSCSKNIDNAYGNGNNKRYRRRHVTTLYWGEKNRYKTLISLQIIKHNPS